MAKIKAEDLSLSTYDVLMGIEDKEEQELPINILHEFANHPFKVELNDEMNVLVESIRESGVLVPLLVRPMGNGEYEIIYGHRRKKAAELAGLDTVPVIIRDLSDDEATIIMVDSNIQREKISPSEKAFAYSMKMNALRHQGKKLDINSTEVIGKQNSDSSRSVSRYIRLTYLNSGLLELVDKGKIGPVVGEILSFLKEEDQNLLLNFINEYKSIPNEAQAQQLKSYSKEDKFNKNSIISVMAAIKPTPTKVILKQKKLKEFFDDGTSADEMESIIIKLLTEWKKGNK